MQLSGLRVLDFCWIGAGAFVTRILADLGAEVIKVESQSHPDNLRLSPPHKPGAKPLESSGYFASRNTSKKSFALNMSHPRAREVALDLAKQCSVVSSNFRPGVMERWGLGYEQVAAVNRSIIYLAMPMQGTAVRTRTISASARRSLRSAASSAWRDCLDAPRSAPARITPTTCPIPGMRWSPCWRQPSIARARRGPAYRARADRIDRERAGPIDPRL
jgi:hypothetical protein